MVAINGRTVGPIGYGLMNLTNRPTSTPDDVAFAILDESLARGSNNWNTSTHYGYNPKNANLLLIARYVAKHPEAAAKIVIAVKSCMNTHDGPEGKSANSLPEEIDASIKNTVDSLGEQWSKLRKEAGLPIIDIFQAGRVDMYTPIEVTAGRVKDLIRDGIVGGFGLSEASADTIRRAHAVTPVSAVEVEYSLWATEIEENGVLAACTELGIPIVAYSPIGRGFLTGSLRSINDIPEGDQRRHHPRFQPDTFDQNLVLVDELKAFAEQKGVPPAQLALSWVRQRGQQLGVTVIPIPGSTKVNQTIENCESVNVQLTKAELEDIAGILEKTKPVGGRYAKLWLDMGYRLFGSTPKLDGWQPSSQSAAA